MAWEERGRHGVSSGEQRGVLGDDCALPGFLDIHSLGKTVIKSIEVFVRSDLVIVDVVGGPRWNHQIDTSLHGERQISRQTTNKTVHASSI